MVFFYFQNNKRSTNDRKLLPNSNAPLNTKPKSNIKGLIDATASLKINNENKQHHKQGPPQAAQAAQQQQQQPQRNTSFEEMFPQAKRFPYKIPGFQNKETNEFAMNVLKMGDQKQSAGNNNSAGNSNVYVNNTVFTNNQPNMQNQNQNAHVPKPQIVPIQQNIQAPKPNFINSNVPPYSLPAMPQPPQQFLWSFKVGDRCLAKYWEDEKYYNAEIQAVTDKTCVVHFPEYGNFEEVLHTDILPITDQNHQPINQYNAMQAPAPIHPIAYTQLPPNKAGPPPHFHQPFHSRK